MTIHDFLVWLASAGGAAVAASFIAERVPAFQALTAPVKGYVMLAASVGLALTAYAVLTYVPAETLAQLAPVFQIVYGLVGTWIANQVAHAHEPAGLSLARNAHMADDVWAAVSITIIGCGIIMGFVTFSLARAFRSFYARELDDLRKNVTDLQFELAMWKRMSQMAPAPAPAPHPTGPLPAVTITNVVEPPPARNIHIQSGGDMTVGELVGGNKTQT